MGKEKNSFFSVPNRTQPSFHWPDLLSLGRQQRTFHTAPPCPRCTLCGWVTDQGYSRYTKIRIRLIYWVQDVGDSLHLPVFSSVRQGYDNINLKGLANFNDVKDLSLYLEQSQPSVGGTMAMSPQCEVKNEYICSCYYLPCSSEPIPSPASARRPSLITLFLHQFLLSEPPFPSQLYTKVNFKSNYSQLVVVLFLHLKS